MNLIIIIVSFSFLVLFAVYSGLFRLGQSIPKVGKSNLIVTISPTVYPTPTLISVPASKIIESEYHIFQTFNNCGPAALSMALTYYGISVSQKELGLSLRPYQNSHGDNDDKSVTLSELAAKAVEYNLVPFHRPNGSPMLIKQFISRNIPVITRTRLNEFDDIGHFRIIKGYDNQTDEYIQDDSLQGQNLRIKYSLFFSLWKMFNFEYLVLVPQEMVQTAQKILGENADSSSAWVNAVTIAQKELTVNPNDVFTRFNLSVALYHTGDYQQSVKEFEKIEKNLPFRTLWYQIEPIYAYYALGNYNRVFDLTTTILERENRAFSELYVLRGEIYKRQGNLPKAKEEFEKAVYYNSNMKQAQEALLSLN